MNDETLLKLSLIGALVFFLLSIYAYYFITTPIGEINENMKGKTVCVNGNFYLEKLVKSCLIGKIYDKTGEINVFICNNTSGFDFLKNNEKLENIKICGKIDIYRGYLEIIPLKIYYS